MVWVGWLVSLFLAGWLVGWLVGWFGLVWLVGLIGWLVGWVSRCRSEPAEHLSSKKSKQPAKGTKDQHVQVFSF